MSRPRWRKLRGDLRAAWGRVLAMQLTITIALVGVGTVLGARAVLGREITASYLATSPADATFELAGGVDDALLAEIAARPEVARADKRQMVRARVRPRPDAPWQMFVLFVAEDFEALRLATFRPATGAWPPPRGTILVERTAVAVMGLGNEGLIESRIELQTPRGAPQVVAIAGTVHDAGQAPNWQEHRGCGYATLDTLAALGEPRVLHELLVELRPAPRSEAEVEAAATTLGRWLRDRGHAVREIRIPKLRQHPHQALMNTSQLVLLVFSLLLLVLSGIVVATLLSAILARQTREIGVMKALGASTGQLAAMYAVFVLGLGVVAVAIAAPLAWLAAHAMIDNLAAMMNVALADPGIPVWVFAAQAALGTLVPLAIAAVPIRRAARLTVRASLAAHGAGADFVRPSLSRLPIALRNALRRPARLAVTCTLLVASGAIAIAAMNLERGVAAISAKLGDARLYDVELRLYGQASGDVLAALARTPGVRTVEHWPTADAALSVAPREFSVVRTYPDGGHGSLVVSALPAGGSALVRFPLLAGRWPSPDEPGAIVLGQGAARGAAVGTRVWLAVGGVRSEWTVTGIVEEVGGASALVAAAGFARAVGPAGGGGSLLRFATGAQTAAERAAILASLEQTLASRGVAVRHAMAVSLLHTIIDDHVSLVARAVIAMAVLLGLVGLLGLGSALAIGVAERTREIGIMKAIGASDRRIFAIVLAEGALVGAASSLVAAALSLPLTAMVGLHLAKGGFHAPPFTVSFAALAGWPLAVVAGGLLASLLPARRAARLSVRAAIGEV